MSGTVSRKVKRQNIVRESLGEKRTKGFTDQLLNLVQQGAGSVTDYIQELTKPVGETIAGIFSADKEVAEAGTSNLASVSNVASAAKKASDAVAVATGAADTGADVEGSRMAKVADVVSGETKTSGAASRMSAGLDASEDIGKFKAEEKEGLAKRGAAMATVGGVIEGAKGKFKQNVEDTGSSFDESVVVDEKLQEELKDDYGIEASVGDVYKRNMFGLGGAPTFMYSPKGTTVTGVGTNKKLL
jgi:hypothetical protein